MSFYDDKFSDEFQLTKEIEVVLESKKAQDLIEELSEKPELARPEDRITFFEGLDDFFTEKLKNLRSTIDDISTEITNRHEFTRKFLYEIDYQITSTACSLGEFKFWGIGYNTGVDKKRNHLERILVELRKKRRATELRAWEDIIALRKEMRGALTEYKDIVRRGNMLHTYGGENGNR